MARNYLKSNRNQNFSKEDQVSLRAFFDFLNANIKLTGEPEFMGLALNYVNFIFAETERPRLIEMTELLRRYSADFGTGSSPEALERMKRFFENLQSHLRGYVEAIMEAVERGEPRIVFEIQGKREVFVDPSKGLFVEDFSLPEPGEHLDLETERQLAETRLFDIIKSLGLRADRFRKCSRARCGKFFYQPSAREKRFCSTRCVKAVVQAEYVKRKQDRER
jgi:hypothetical protein